MKIGKIFKLIFVAAIVSVITWLVIEEIQFQQIKKEIQNTSWHRQMLA
jgi:cell division protein FtsL